MAYKIKKSESLETQAWKMGKNLATRTKNFVINGVNIREEGTEKVVDKEMTKRYGKKWTNRRQPKPHMTAEQEYKWKHRND